MSTGRANRPDTPADLKLRDYLTASSKRCFNMVAGAGSGKTTSLVKALTFLVEEQGTSLKLRRQRIACITYTEIAAQEVWADVGSNPLVHVSTIHSFLWMIARSFQEDIRAWALQRVKERIADLHATAAGFGPRVQQRTREKNRRDVERFEAALPDIARARAFTYGTGSNYADGTLGHDDVIRVATDFLCERPLFQRLLAQQFPYVFVDESQDTQEAVITALKRVAARAGPRFCLGFFGDPMQKIYATGIGVVPEEGGWRRIPKEENFRCATAVLAVANAIRRDGDDLVQIGGRIEEVDGERQTISGSARIFILPADGRRDASVAAVMNWIADHNADEGWRAGPQAAVKMLVIVHRMAANRLGFGNLYAAMNDKAPQAFRDGFLDARAWPIRPFETFVLPVVEAIEGGNEFAVMTLLRQYCPLLSSDQLPRTGISQLLKKLRKAVSLLGDQAALASTATVRDVLTLLRDEQLITFDPRLLSALAEAPLGVDEQRADEEDEAEREIAALDRFLACEAREFRGYRRYVKEESPFSTQQGVKGAEFERVLVVLDDDEGTHFQFSYDKYFGVSPLSSRDRANMEEGLDNIVDRTRRLFYVCCTRAETDLAVVYFSKHPVEAEKCVRSADLFSADSIFSAQSLALPSE